MRIRREQMKEGDAAFRKLVQRVALWPILAILLMGCVLVGLIHFLLDSARWVEHSDNVVSHTRAVEATLLGMQSALRDYQVTRSAEFLAPYERGDGATETETQTLLELVSDNPEQQEAVRRFQAASGQWREFAREMIEHVRAGAGADDPALNTSGRERMERVRARAAEVAGAEGSLRLERMQKVDRVRTGLFAGIALAVCLLGAAAVFWIRSLPQRVTSTYRESADEASRRAEELQVSLRSIGDAVISTDAKGRVVFLNPVAEKVTGWATAEAAGKALDEIFVIFNEHTGEPAKNPVARVLREQAIVGLANHTVLRARDGREIPIEDSAAPIVAENGEVQGVILVFHDVTEARATRRQVRESGERVQAALTGSGAGTFRWDIQTNALEGDENFDRFFGPASDEPIRSWANFIARIHPDERGGVMVECERCARECLDFDMEFRVPWPDGADHWLHGRAKTFCDEKCRAQQMTGACVEITARKESERALADAQTRLEATVRSSEIGTWVWHIQEDRVIADANLARFFSVSPADAAGGPIANYLRAIYPEDMPEVEAVLARAMQSESGEYEVDYRLVRPGETPRWVVARGKVEHDAEGEPVRFPGVVIDVTARKGAEAAQRKSEEFLRLVLDSTADAFYSVDREGATTLCNVAFARMVGFERAEDAIGKKLHGVIHHSHPDGSPYPKEECPLYRTARTGEPAHRDDELFFRLDGSSFPVEYWSYPIMREGELHGAVTTFIDITERRQAEAALRESAERFRFLAESMPQKIFTATPAGEVDYFNLEWMQFTGLSFEQIRDWGWLQFIHPEDVEENIRTWQHSIDTGEPFYLEHRFLRTDGAYRWHVSRAVPMRDADGKVLMWIGSNSDIQEVRQANEAAEAASRTKDEFLAALSHELRTPLTPVLMTLSTLRDETRLPLDVREQIGMMKRNIELEARLIDDLLDLTRISKGKLALRLEECDAHSLVALAIEMVRSEALRKRQTVEVDLAAERSQISGDPARLQQVFWNVLKNAVKFTPESGHLAVRSRDAAQQLVIEVSDTGIGIDRESMERIFLPFEQAASLSAHHRFGGLGLGLSISKAIVELHGGAIAAASIGQGSGATFRVELPASENTMVLVADEPSRSPDGRSAERRAEKLPAMPMRLLLVEDNEPTLAVLERLLTRAGHAVTTAMTVAGALATAAGPVEFDALVSDVGLPDGTGFELMEKLQTTYGLRGIALSGYGMDEDLRRSREAGFAMHLTKPIDFAQLEEALARLAES